MDWIQLVGNHGFPIVVSLYLLVKTQQRLEEMSTLLTSLSETLKSEDRSRSSKSP
jgi:hypothetical protein